MLQAGGSRVWDPVWWMKLIYLILPAELGLEVYSASNRNEYQNQEKNVSGSRVRPVSSADNVTAICAPIV
jgi:hypothetical protein